MEKSVLDLGAMAGFYSFETERHGAHRVLAVDLLFPVSGSCTTMAISVGCQEKGIANGPDKQKPNRLVRAKILEIAS